MQDHDELEQVLERTAAKLLGHGASLIEALMRRLRQSAEEQMRQEAAQDDPALSSVARHTEPELGSAPSPIGGLSDSELDAQVKARYGLDVSRIGDREHDRQWADRAAPADVLDLLRAADRDGDGSATAARLRDNLMERIREYGIDADALLSESPEAAGEALRENRESFLGENDPAIDRDAAEVTSLMGRAQAADREAETLSAHADDGYAAADNVSRSGQVAAGTTGTGAATAATLAAKDHPTNPRRAAVTAAKQAPKAKPPAGRGADRERGHSGR
ncbi:MULTISPECIES: hypothetical protein [Gordonia]|uniref:Uncharacterized protein n=2 Tax=Gordonia sihwensis TaxID=173559 RepID=L7LNM5_9ACTN|nr:MULTISPECIES: hypothetical protein [Gordonia]GAC62331.1 hypothetical protein GSI01S_33_00170 [Gordonia sihwensis NBRC 108236]